MSAAYDALVVGGGPGGSTTALLLAQAGWSVLLVERQRLPRRKVCGEYISGTSLPLLDRLGVGTAFREQAGPEVRSVGLFAGQTVLAAPLPRPSAGWGRALPREVLDTLLVERAAAAGAEVWQGHEVASVLPTPEGFACRIGGSAASSSRHVTSRLVVAAHGSWESGSLPTQVARMPARASDLLGFKAHFRDTRLPAGLMPLLAFPGGYGGMVHVGGGSASLSCCVRRDVLARLRERVPGEAGEALLAHLRTACRGVREALADSTRAGPWLGAGPMRPGVRVQNPAPPGMFRVGNAAGEAHPVVAEGISMAMQGGCLLAGRLRAWSAAGAPARGLSAVRRDYARLWRRHFAGRVRASMMVARWAMSPAALAATLPVLRTFPGLLTFGARCTGKAANGIQGSSPAPPRNLVPWPSRS